MCRHSDLRQARLLRLLLSLWTLGTFVLCVGGVVSAPLSAAGEDAEDAFPNGVAVGDIGQWGDDPDTYSAVLWARAGWEPLGEDTKIYFEYGTHPQFKGAVFVDAEIDSSEKPVKVEIHGLSAGGQKYYYRACRGECPPPPGSGGDAVEIRSDDDSGDDSCNTEKANPLLEARGCFETPHLDGHHGLKFGASSCAETTLRPYAALQNVPERGLDFFVHLGDGVYADKQNGGCWSGQEGALTRGEFRCAHRAALSGKSGGRNVWAEIRAKVPLYATFDDHEVRNDVAGGAKTSRRSPLCRVPKVKQNGGKRKLITDWDEEFCPKEELKEAEFINQMTGFKNGVAAFAEHNPIREGKDEEYDTPDDSRTDGRRRFYRYRTFGEDAAIFVLDARSFREKQDGLRAVAVPTLGELFLKGSVLSPLGRKDSYSRRFYRGRKRTMLGAAQLADLKADLRSAQESGVTWKFVLLPEPIQHLGPFVAADRFEGYALERDELLQFIVTGRDGVSDLLDPIPIDNVVFISGDIHGTVVNNLVYRKRRGRASQSFSGTWDISTGPIAHGALGEVEKMEELFVGKFPNHDGAVNELEYYKSLDREGRNRYLERRFNDLLSSYKLPQVGLCEGVREEVDAELIQGSYMAVNTYGWTEFEIFESKKLRVTTWGVDPYSEEEAQEMGDELLEERVPEEVSIFEVTPRAQSGSVGSMAACVSSSCLRDSACEEREVCDRRRCVPKESLNGGEKCTKDDACRSGKCVLFRCQPDCGDGVCDALRERCGNTNAANDGPDKLRNRWECVADCGACSLRERCRRDVDCAEGLQCGFARKCRECSARQERKNAKCKNDAR